MSLDTVTYPLVTRENIAILDGILYDLKPVADSLQEHLDDHVTNPVLAFQLIHRFIFIWVDHIKMRVQEDIGDELRQLLNSSSRLLSLKSDFSGACQAIFRMQYIYQISTSNFANGVLPGADVKTFPAQLGVEHCFKIGAEAYDIDDYHMCVTWMEESLRRLDAGYPVRRWDEANKIRILEYIASCHYLDDRIHEAISFTRHLLQIDPDHKNAKTNLKLYEKVATENRFEMEGPMNGQDHRSHEGTGQRYGKYCRGEIPEPSTRIHRNLYCYRKSDHPLLRLQPVGVEILHANNPRVVLFKDVVTERECKMMKEKARPMLQASGVVESEDKVTFTNYRISNTAWLIDKYDPRLMTVAKRIEAMSGLNIHTAEPFQVVNYGIGGMYAPHVDYDRNHSVLKNRVATFLLYLSDVTWGGGTVFTKLGTMALPSKGDALYWYNMKRSGDHIPESQHAGCPVVLGEKWIANKWFSYVGQENHFKCGLSPDSPE
ncbi:prolyl 4-hydroxylase subunit alpha-2-like [Ptychodera flava]|uniref:prolyl 4-hydroxylase subunit alpha-2-like n=1 Tax=Ptychodera flava TaxID=63121 RepID=UPI003969DD96